MQQSGSFIQFLRVRGGRLNSLPRTFFGPLGTILTTISEQTPESWT